MRLKGESPVDSAINGDEPARARLGAALMSKTQVVAIAYGGWLFLFSILFHKFGENKVVLEVALLLGVVPALMHCLLLDIDTRGMAPGMWFLWAFMLIFIAGYMVNGCEWTDLVNILNVSFVFTIGIIIASSSDTSLLPRLCGAYAVMLSPYLIYVSLFGIYVWGRLMDGLEPNLWGLFAVSVAVGSFALKSRILSAFCWLALLMITYAAQARGSMLSLTPLICIVGYYWYKYERNIDVSWKMLLTIIVLGCVFIILAAYPDILIDKILRLHDSRRGVGSGATGRSEAWIEASRLFFNAPLLGVGFRKHEQLMVFTLLSSHNAYLAMLADTGFLGFLVYIGFLLSSALSALRGVGEPKLRLFLLGVILSYCVAGLFERRAINVGNPLSIIFIFACLQSLQLARFALKFKSSHPGRGGEHYQPVDEIRRF